MEKYTVGESNLRNTGRIGFLGGKNPVLRDGAEQVDYFRLSFVPTS